MNCRELVLAALRCEQVDRVPWLEIGFAGEIAGQILGEPVIGGTGYHPHADLEVYEHYLRQMIRLSEKIGLCTLPLKCWSPAFSRARTGEGVRVYGREGLITDLASLERYTAQAPEPADMAFAACAEVFARRAAETQLCRVFQVGGVYSHSEASMNLEGLSIALYEQPELVRRMFQWQADFVVATLELLLPRYEVDFVLYGDDMAFKTGTFMSPAHFREFLWPHLKRICDTVKRFGLPIVLHSDGNLLEIMDDLLAAGFVGIHPMENLAMDIVAVHEKYGDRLCCIGNLDVDLIDRCPVEQVEAEVRRLLRSLGRRGYIFASGNSITQWARLENVLAISRLLAEQEARG